MQKDLERAAAAAVPRPAGEGGKGSEEEHADHCCPKVEGEQPTNPVKGFRVTLGGRSGKEVLGANGRRGSGSRCSPLRPICPQGPPSEESGPYGRPG